MLHVREGRRGIGYRRIIANVRRFCLFRMLNTEIYIRIKLFNELCG